MHVFDIDLGKESIVSVFAPPRQLDRFAFQQFGQRVGRLFAEVLFEFGSIDSLQLHFVLHFLAIRHKNGIAIDDPLHFCF